jgi:hypothetical protein
VKLIQSLVFVLGLVPSFAFALTFKPLMSTSLEFGGDILVSITYSDGSTSKITGGQGMSLNGGAYVALVEESNHQIDVQATLGVKYAGSKKTTNGGMNFLRFPIEVLGFYSRPSDKFRVGGGLAYHFANQLKGTQDAAGLSADFKNTLAFLAQGDYFMGEKSQFGLGLRYTLVSYQVASSPKVDGNSFGFVFSFLFP